MECESLDRITSRNDNGVVSTEADMMEEVQSNDDGVEDNNVDDLESHSHLDPTSPDLTKDDHGDHQITEPRPDSAPEEGSEDKVNTDDVQTTGCIHLLRCSWCNLETIQRERFDKHLPCSRLHSTYSLFVCSKCSNCSTLKSIMEEHRECCHRTPGSSPCQIKEVPIRFIQPDSDDQAPASHPRPNHESSHEQDPQTPNSCQSIEKPVVSDNSTTMTTSLKVESDLVTKPCQSPSSLVNGSCRSSQDDGEPVSLVRSTNNHHDQSHPANNGLNCQICGQHKATDSELAKHLALTHLLPFPAVLSHLSKASQCNIADKTTVVDKSDLDSCVDKRTEDVCSTHTVDTFKHSNPQSMRSSEHQSGSCNSTDSISNTQSSLRCPQCSLACDSINQFQSHLVQVHSNELASLFNLTSLLNAQIPSDRQQPSHVSLFTHPWSPPGHHRSSASPTCPIPPFVYPHQSSLGSRPSLFPIPPTSHFVSSTNSLQQPSDLSMNNTTAHRRAFDYADGKGADQMSATPTNQSRPDQSPFPLLDSHLAMAAAALLHLPFNHQSMQQSGGDSNNHSIGRNQVLKRSFDADRLMSGERMTEIDGKIEHQDPSSCYAAGNKRLRPTEQNCIERRRKQGHPLTNTLNGCGPVSSKWQSSGERLKSESKFGPSPLMTLAPSTTASGNPLTPSFDKSLHKSQQPWSPIDPRYPMSSPQRPTHYSTRFDWPSAMVSSNNAFVDPLNSKQRVDDNSSPTTQQLLTPTVNNRLSPQQSIECGESAESRERRSSSRNEASGPGDDQSNRQDNSSCTASPLSNILVHNTLRKTKSDMKVIQRYLVQVKRETREVHLLPGQELDRHIQEFVLTAKKKDGHEYEPESLKAFVHSLERHLKYHGYQHSVLKGSVFAGTRTVLNKRLAELRALSRSGTATTTTNQPGSQSGAKRGQNGEENGAFISTSSSCRRIQGNLKRLSSTTFVQSGVLGTESPQAILNSLWLMNRTQFNIGGTQRHRNLVWGQFQLVYDDRGEKVIKFTPLFESSEVRYCKGFGGPRSASLNSQTANSCKRQPLPFNCVELFELYANLRPIEARGVSEPLYLSPDPSWERGGVWFKSNAAGSQLLSRIPRLLGLKPNRDGPMHSDSNRQKANLEAMPSSPLGSSAPSSTNQMKELDGRNFKQTLASQLAQFNPSMFNLFPLMFSPPQLQQSPLTSDVSNFIPPSSTKLPLNTPPAALNFSRPTVGASNPHKSPDRSTPPTSYNVDGSNSSTALIDAEDLSNSALPRSLDPFLLTNKYIRDNDPSTTIPNRSINWEERSSFNQKGDESSSHLSFFDDPDQAGAIRPDIASSSSTNCSIDKVDVSGDMNGGSGDDRQKWSSDGTVLNLAQCTSDSFY